MQFTRDWFLTRFRLLADDILVEQEKRIRRYKFWENSRHLTQLEVDGVDNLRVLLEGGIQVMHHQRSGKIEQSVLKFDSKSTTFELQALKRPVFGFWAVQPMVTFIYIIAYHFAIKILILTENKCL